MIYITLIMSSPLQGRSNIEEIESVGFKII